MSPASTNQMTDTAAQFNTHATSPWTDWADKFASANYENGANGHQNGNQAQSDQNCSDALMDCYNG